MSIKSLFPQVHLLTCLDYFDSHNVVKDTQAAMLEVREMLLLMGTLDIIQSPSLSVFKLRIKSVYSSTNYS